MCYKGGGRGGRGMMFNQLQLKGCCCVVYLGGVEDTRGL